MASLHVDCLVLLTYVNNEIWLKGLLQTRVIGSGRARVAHPRCLCLSGRLSCAEIQARSE
jgi:hypothetical protein